MALTQKDLDKLSCLFTIKAESKKFATKADLEKFATKLDLEKLKSEYLDVIMKKLEDILLEQKLAYSQYRRHDEKLDNHEKRLEKLEVSAS